MNVHQIVCCLVLKKTPWIDGGYQECLFTDHSAKHIREYIDLWKNI